MADTREPILKDLGEFGLIRMIKENCHFGSSHFIKGIGDDCAVIGPYGEKVFLITTDLLIENIHFLSNKITPIELGHKAVTVNISDIAAMGGTPLHIFVSIACPPSYPVKSLESIFTGIKQACKKYRVNLLGGDTSASRTELFVNITVIGEAPKDKVLYRKGAKPGDLIYVTGELGDSAAGLAIIKGNVNASQDIALALINAHHKPTAHVGQGNIIAQSGLASAMIDISDGLVSDLGHICESSHVGAIIYETSIPLSRELRALATEAGIDPLHFALHGGEDYKLLVTVPQHNRMKLENLFRKNNNEIFFVGEITEETHLKCIGLDGKKKPLRSKGFDHFG